MTVTNPLRTYFRHPAIYVKLPSGGKFWPEGALDMPPTGEVGIMPMTAKDELTLKVPDALLNGQAVVDIIHSCVPSVKNAWECPTLDFEVLLAGIRIASFGEKMNPPANVVDKAAITAMMAMRGNTITNPSTMALPKIEGSSSALSVIFLSNCNWLLNRLPMLLNKYWPIMVKNKVAITIMAAGASSCERAIWPSSRALLNLCAVGSSVLSWPLSSAMSVT